MRRVSFEEYLGFAGERGFVEVEGTRIRLDPIVVKRFNPTQGELTDVSTTVWSFPERGSWATHKGDYRGNWPPQVARALILMYTEPGDTVLDPMVGGGTTCIEAKLLGRNCIGVDISYDAVMLTLHRLYWLQQYLEEHSGKTLGPISSLETGGGEVPLEEALKARVEVYHGDAGSLNDLPPESVDLVATHPPYYNIIRYSRGAAGSPGDLSTAMSLEEYLSLLRRVAGETYRVLKPGHYAGVLVGDTRIHGHYVPITHHVLRLLLETGFILKEEVVKMQHKMKATREKWAKMRGRGFLLIYHEKLFILRKPRHPREYKKYKYSALLNPNQEPGVTSGAERAPSGDAP